VDRTWFCKQQERTDQEVLFEAAKHISSKLFHLTNAVEMEAPDVQQVPESFVVLKLQEEYICRSGEEFMMEIKGVREEGAEGNLSVLKKGKIRETGQELHNY